MKKFLILITATILALCFGILLVACDALGQITGGQEGDDETISYNADKIDEQFETLRKDKGFYIEMKGSGISEGGSNAITYAYGAKDSIYYVESEGDEIIIDLSNAKEAVTFSREDGEVKWTKNVVKYGDGITQQYYQTVVDQSISGIFGLMSNYKDFSFGKMKKSTATIAGRSCDKFTNTTTTFTGSVTVEFCIDKATGACLKYAASGVSTEGSGSFNFECTSFKESYSVTIPSATDIEDNYDPDPDLDPDPDPEDKVVATPDISIDDNGLATWTLSSKEGFANTYFVDVNGNVKSISEASYQLHDGETIKVKAAGDNETYFDSNWSSAKTYTKKIVYDFTNIGLSANNEKTLTYYETATPGGYYNDKIFVCENKDVIAYRGDSWIDMYSRNDGYKLTTLIFNYSQDKSTTDYELIDFKESKLSYYETLLQSVSIMQYYNTPSSNTVYADYNDFVAKRDDTTLLAYNVYDTDNISSYELEKYTEYSGFFDTKYINTGYLHESRKYSYLNDYSDKIQKWSVERVNLDKNYSDSCIQITFNENFTETDYLALLNTLKEKGLTPYEGYSFNLSSYGINSFNGDLCVYSFPYEEEGDGLYDEYTLTGGTASGNVIPYTLTIEYTYLTWFDGGTFATYVTKPNGLWRIVDNYRQLMISPDGTVEEHVLAPSKQLNDFSISYTTDVEGDEEYRQEGYFVNTYSVEKVGDTLIYTEVGEYDERYVIVKKIDGKFYKIEGSKSEGEYSWDEAYETQAFNDGYDDLYNILASYFNNQFKAIGTTDSEKIAGYDCLKYSYTEDDITYFYYVTDDGLTLKTTNTDEYAQTCLVKTINTEVTEFSANSSAAIANSGINTYVPTEE